MSPEKSIQFTNAIKSNDLKQVEENFDLEFLNKTDSEGYKPIHYACSNNSVEIFKFLLRNKCDIEAADSKNNRPIHHAIEKGADEILKLLIGNQCDLDCKNSKGETLIEMADNRGAIKEILEKSIQNREIGVEMNLKCSADCDHKFCLISFCLNEFDKNDVIGRGGFGKVYRVVDSYQNRVFAVKKVTWTEFHKEKPSNEDNLTVIQKDARWVENNINNYKSKLMHKHIVKYYGAFREDYKMFIFMEYMAGETVYKKIKEDGLLPHDKIIKYSQHVLLGLDFLQKQVIIHRDIKPSNLLLDENDNCKLSDFGLSRLLQSLSTQKLSINSKNKKDKNSNVAKTVCGTANYMAPEVIIGAEYSYPCDLWSLGASIIEMLTGKMPYSNIGQNTVILKIAKERKLDYELKIKPPEELIKFLNKLLSPEPVDRGTAEELLKNNLFNI